MFPTLTSFERDLNNPYLNRNNLLAGSSVTKTTCLAPSTLPAASKLLVSNLPLNFDEDAVYKFLRSFGKIKSLEMIKDPITGNYSGQCHIEYETESATANALHCNIFLFINRCYGNKPTG
jgi:RNA recognition motif-containing protein